MGGFPDHKQHRNPLHKLRILTCIMTDSNEIAGIVVANPGLSSDEVAHRRAQHGPNALEEKRVSVLRQLGGYFWGPIPWIIKVAAVLSALVRHLADFFIIVTFLIFNAAVDFWQEYTAGNAVTALMKQLALRARVRRDARQLVPGDIVRIRPGDVIPADIKLAATLLTAYDFELITPITWPEIALIWGYSFVSAMLTDWVKVQVYRHMSQDTPLHHRFLGRIQQSLHIFERRK